MGGKKSGNHAERGWCRKPPVLSFLDRDNPINKYLGLLLSRVGLR